MEEAPEMRQIDKISNTIAVIVPFVATIAAMVLFWNRIVTPADLIIAFSMYLVTGIGVTVGFHRLLTHKSFQTFRPVQYLFAILGSMSVQGPVITWTADHRKHHAHTDEPGDPHSPHVGHGEGFRGVMGGLWHAHIGWSMSEHGRADRERYAADLCADRGMVLIDRLFPLWLILSLAIPTLAGYLVTGTAAGALGGLLWGGLVRIFFVHHITWSINSLCHFMGTRRFDTDDYSTNVFWLALPSFGEAWHNNHHAFPRSAVHGMKKWELDPSAAIITGLEKVGLARKVIRISPERQAQKLAGKPVEPADGTATRGPVEPGAGTP